MSGLSGGTYARKAHNIHPQKPILLLQLLAERASRSSGHEKRGGNLVGPKRTAPTCTRSPAACNWGPFAGGSGSSVTSKGSAFMRSSCPVLQRSALGHQFWNPGGLQLLGIDQVCIRSVSDTMSDSSSR